MPAGQVMFPQQSKLLEQGDPAPTQQNPYVESQVFVGSQQSATVTQA